MISPLVPAYLAFITCFILWPELVKEVLKVWYVGPIILISCFVFMFKPVKMFTLFVLNIGYPSLFMYCVLISHSFDDASKSAFRDVLLTLLIVIMNAKGDYSKFPRKETNVFFAIIYFLISCGWLVYERSIYLAMKIPSVLPENRVMQALMILTAVIEMYICCEIYFMSKMSTEYQVNDRGSEFVVYISLFIVSILVVPCSLVMGMTGIILVISVAS